MRVLYDSQIFRIQKFGGVSRYCAELINGLDKEVEFDFFPKKIYSHNSYLNMLGHGKFNRFRKYPKFPGKYRIENYIRKIEDKQLFHVIKSSNYDVYHPTYYYPAYLDLIDKRKPVIATIHDMTYELYYDKKFNRIHEETLSKKKLIQRADHIIAVSQNTKNDILNLYPEIQESKISVIYHGSSLRSDLPDSSIKLPDNYILYVGKRGKYKNFSWMLNAIAEFLIKNNKVLVCAGGRPFSEEENSTIAEKKLTGRVVYFNINKDEDLATMYKNANCFIYPSSHEGFGIPILEAFSCGCPVLLAQSSCFPEIGADAALYFENENKEGFLSQLTKICEDSSVANKLIEDGYKRLQYFSWEKMVQQHVKVYKKVVTTI